jgi:hypothetical protein
MIRNFLITISFVSLFSCQNNSVSVVTEPAYKNIEKTVPQQTIKIGKKSR